MKPKISPTSPKAKNEQEKNLDNYYKNSLGNIEKPNKQKTPIWFLFVVIIFGFMAGILGQLVLLSYGSEIPYLDKLDIFSLTENQPFFIKLNNNDNNTIINEANKIAENQRNSIVQIFEKNNSSEALNSMYVPEKQLGLGVAITEDGYIITTNQVISNYELEYVAITEKKEIFLINEILLDPSTNFIILKTDISNLQAMNMTDYNEIFNAQDVLLLNKYGFTNEPQIQFSSIKSKDYKMISTSLDYFYSTEKLTESLLLDSSNIMQNSLAFSLDGQVIGMVTNQNGVSIIYPFYMIENKITSIVENNEVIRPYVGITYLNLVKIANISNELSQGQTNGALIYFDEEGTYPGIISNSPAEKSGLKSNDIILEVNNQKINGNYNLSRIIQEYNAGDIITFKIYRQGEELEIKLTLESII